MVTLEKNIRIKKIIIHEKMSGSKNANLVKKCLILKTLILENLAIQEQNFLNDYSQTKYLP